MEANDSYNPLFDSDRLSFRGSLEVLKAFTTEKEGKLKQVANIMVEAKGK